MARPDRLRRGLDRFPDVDETVYGVKKRLNFVGEALGSLGRGLPGRDPTSILDIGCGTGELLAIPLAAQGYEVLGIDTDAPSIEHARSTCEERSIANARFEVALAEDVEGRFDVVVLSEVIEHVDDPGALLATIRSLLEPDGLLVLTLPNGYGPFEIDSYLWKRNFLGVPKLHARYSARAKERSSEAGRASALATCNEHSPHIQFFSWTRINRVIDQAGFSVVRYCPRSLISGNFASVFVQALRMVNLQTRWLVAANARVAELLPPQLSSDWMFVCVPTGEIG